LGRNSKTKDYQSGHESLAWEKEDQEEVLNFFVVAQK
jgi:hypothetical protein